MIKLLKCFRERLIRIIECEDGSVTVFICLVTASVLILAAALALDLTRGEILQGRMSSALDAAGLAVEKQVRTIPSGNQQTWANAQATRFFNANFPVGYLDTSPISITVSPVTPDWATITLHAHSTMPTLIMKDAGIKSIHESASSEVTAVRSISR